MLAARSGYAKNTLTILGKIGSRFTDGDLRRSQRATCTGKNAFERSQRAHSVRRPGFGTLGGPAVVRIYDPLQLV